MIILNYLVFHTMIWTKCLLCHKDNIGLIDPIKNGNCEVNGYSWLAYNITAS